MAWTAANSLTTNLIALEVFNANVTISDTPITVRYITFVSAAAGDDFALQINSAEDNGVNTITVVVVHLAQNVSGGMVTLDFGEKGHTFPNLYFDTNSINAGLGAGDRVLIYLK